jgi:hypothetical protein
MTYDFSTYLSSEVTTGEKEIRWRGIFWSILFSQIGFLCCPLTGVSMVEMVSPAQPQPLAFTMRSLLYVVSMQPPINQGVLIIIAYFVGRRFSMTMAQVSWWRGTLLGGGLCLGAFVLWMCVVYSSTLTLYFMGYQTINTQNDVGGKLFRT